MIQEDISTIAFDVDGTLIHQVGGKEDTPRYDVISLLLFFVGNGHDVFIWSGGGLDYAQRWAEKLGLAEIQVVEKGSFVPDIAFDDEAVTLGKVNVRV